MIVLAVVLLLGPVGQLINEARDTAGCNPLVATRDELIIDARRHSREMEAAGYIYHSELELGHWSQVGEVIGMGTTRVGIGNALLQSPPHVAILLDCRYDKIALGWYSPDEHWLTARLYAN